MLGNLLLFFIAVSLAGLLSITSAPIPGGDRGMGAGILVFVCGVAFLLLTGVYAWHLGWNNSFDWLEMSVGQRNGLIFLGWLAFSTATIASALFRMEWHNGEFPQFLRWLSQAKAAFWLPLLMLVPSFFLLNFEREAGHAPDFVKIPMMTGFILSILMGLGLMFGLFRGNAQQQAAIIESVKTQNNNIHQNHLEWIEQQKPTDPIVNILALTGRFHDTDVRDAAIAKVKSLPDWEKELIRLLSETQFDTEVYHFIDGNQVEHPELFVEPIKHSIQRVAGEIKVRIKDSNNLQDWHFEHFSLERLFRAIDEQFLLPGADYRPAIQELRIALDTPKPERFQKVKFKDIPLVDAWLKKHK